MSAIFDSGPGALKRGMARIISGAVTAPGALFTEDGFLGMVDRLAETAARFEALPPRPARFIARYDVPYGLLPRMWNARGDMVVYVNRSWFDKMPRQKYMGVEVIASPLVAPGILGIPVLFEECS